MKQLTCEMCESTNLVKQDGFFVCQECGCKYSVEEARRMMSGDGASAPTAAGKNTLIENYLSMASNALSVSNNEEAESYANKTIELDPKNSKAWEIKAEAAGWQSTTTNSRMAEAVNAWLNAIQYLPEDESMEALSDRIADGYTRLFLAMVNLRANNFGKLQTDENLKSLKADIQNGIAWMNILMTRGGVSFNRACTYNDIARKLNKAAVDGFKDAGNDFGPAHSNMAKWQWENYYNSCDNCLAVLDEAVRYCTEGQLGVQICENYAFIGEKVRDSGSWRFDVNAWTADHYVSEYAFTAEAKASRNKKITAYNEKKVYFSNDQVKSTVELIQATRKYDEIALGKKKYWEEHAEEKQRLEAERADLEDQIDELKDQIDELPICKEIEKTLKEIDAKTAERDALGIFKFKEKKALQAQIDELTLKKARQENQRREETAPLKRKIDAHEKRIKEIEDEFAAERGRAELDDSDRSIANVLADGRFTVSVRELAEHLDKILPKDFSLNEITCQASKFADFGNQYKISFKGSAGTNYVPDIYCTASDMDTPIENIILQSGNAAIQGVSAREYWGIVGAHLFLALFPGLKRGEAEEFVVDLRHNEKRSLWVRDGIRYEFASNSEKFYGIDLDFSAVIIRPRFK